MNEQEIDHIDGNRRNNLISNLRLVTSSQNKLNPIANLKMRNNNGRSVRVASIDKNGLTHNHNSINGVYHKNKNMVNGIHFFISREMAVKYNS